MNVHIAAVVIAVLVASATASSIQRQKDESNVCRVDTEEGVIDLSLLQNIDYTPRYSVEGADGWTYSFNPCSGFNLPSDPHSGAGDQCAYVAVSARMCKSRKNEFYALGWRNDADFTVYHTREVLAETTESVVRGNHSAFESLVGFGNQTLVTAVAEPEPEMQPANINTVVAFLLRGKRSLLNVTTTVVLQCNADITGEPLFTVANNNSTQDLTFVLTHKCCCFNGCYIEVKTEGGSKHKKPRCLWIIIIGVSFVIGVAISLCHFCGHSSSSAAESPYTFLPAIHGGRSVTSHIETFIPSSIVAKLSLDGNITAGKTSHTPSFMNLPEEPVVALGATAIPQADITFKQRLGGGAFCDTYLAEHHNNRIAAKRITVGIHKGQITQAQVNWLTDEVKLLIKQKHTNLIQILGVCLDSREPYVLTEFSPANAFKELLNVARYPNRTFLQNLDIVRRSLLRGTYYLPKQYLQCMQIAEGLNYLHSSKPPILHRDLRASNVLVTNDGNAKVVDFGHTRLVQQFRMDCVKEKCFCNKQWSALPASLRWTAPEILIQPTAVECSSSTIFTPAVDIYSYGMVLYETATASLPFDQVVDEKEVMELVIKGERPSTQSVITLPQYIDVMTQCWSETASERPGFKTIMMQLTAVANLMKNMSSAKRRLHDVQSTQFKSALSMKSISSTKH